MREEAHRPAAERCTRFVVDRTHMGRRASGIERITDQLFSPPALHPIALESSRECASRSSMIVQQMLANPTRAMLSRDTVWVFPGYPPSPAFVFLRERTVFYVHDLFLITRSQDLNRGAKLYMAPPFRLAIGALRYFLVNSETTLRELLAWVRPDAEVRLYRPVVGNVFGVTPRTKEQGSEGPLGRTRPLIVGALGTIEPRKNFLAAARVCEDLRRRLDVPVELHIIGRPGWGKDATELGRMPGVVLHGFLDDDEARAAIGRFDLFLSTAHDEGLGLPLLEMQYAGLPVVVPDQPIFREVLGGSGTFVDPARPDDAARTIARLFDAPDWRSSAARAAAANLDRWNRQAEADRRNVVAFLSAIAAGSGVQQEPAR
ncbi:group 1 glycosyl transferase [Rhodoplanes elegans]|uniref:Group 1 glycosyl transferase n=2 Tax=Rhodoplanes elegans TaxID=29408 RepID=A0A327KN24_9BRAD|nr:group 1 glycosyl transferase [Rhodoplanes elegans]RAI36768.1 group 1 glycosyl transferase [Rhodoplanes elegans]